MTRGLRLSAFLVATSVAPYAFGQSQTATPLELGNEHSPTSAGPTTAPPEPAAPAPPAASNTSTTGPTRGATEPATTQGLTSMSLDPAAPELSALPGGVSPAFGVASTGPGDWRFDFHGLLFVPLRVGFNSRANPTSDQASTTLHAPAVVPGDFATFGYTNIAPDPWAQVNFSYGNRDVTATIIIAARSITEGNSFFNPPDQLGINDAFITFRLANTDRYKIKLDVGAFSNRYGNMGEYDSGRYGTPVIARIGGVGITETGSVYLDKGVTLLTEVGLMGQLNKAPLGVEPAGWNGYLDANAGTSFVPHLHLGASYLNLAQVGFHVMRAFSQDDRATPTNQPDGYIDVYAADARLTLKRYGHVYLALSETQSHHARAVSDVIQVLNAPGGYGLMNSYFGLRSGGGGDLTTVAMQYDLSIGNLLRFPQHFEGLGPDVVASLFGIYTGTDTSDPDPLYFGTTLKYATHKLKYGAEVSYTPLSWLAVSGRYDRVLSNVDDATQTTSIVTPRVIFRSAFNARDQVVLQYSHYFNGSNVYATTGVPPPGGIVPNLDLTVRPDADVLSLMASMWW